MADLKNSTTIVIQKDQRTREPPTAVLKASGNKPSHRGHCAGVYLLASAAQQNRFRHVYIHYTDNDTVDSYLYDILHPIVLAAVLKMWSEERKKKIENDIYTK